MKVIPYTVCPYCAETNGLPAKPIFHDAVVRCKHCGESYEIDLLTRAEPPKKTMRKKNANNRRPARNKS